MPSRFPTTSQKMPSRPASTLKGYGTREAREKVSDLCEKLPGLTGMIRPQRASNRRAARRRTENVQPGPPAEERARPGRGRRAERPRRGEGVPGTARPAAHVADDRRLLRRPAREARALASTMGPANTHWFHGRVCAISIDASGDTVSIDYDDGDHEDGVYLCFVVCAVSNGRAQPPSEPLLVPVPPPPGRCRLPRATSSTRSPPRRTAMRGNGSGVVMPDAADEAETRPTSPADEPEPNELLDALTEAWTLRTEGGDGTEKPVPNAEGWSIYWTERVVPGGATATATCARPTTLSSARSRKSGTSSNSGATSSAAASPRRTSTRPTRRRATTSPTPTSSPRTSSSTPTPAGDNRADVAVGQKLSVCWETMPDGGLQVLLHGVEPEGTLQWFEAEVKEAGLGRDWIHALLPRWTRRPSTARRSTARGASCTHSSSRRTRANAMIASNGQALDGEEE